MFRGVSGTCQNTFRMIYFEAEAIFRKKWFWFLVLKTGPKRDGPPPPPRGGGSPGPSYGHEPKGPSKNYVIKEGGGKGHMFFWKKWQYHDRHGFFFLVTSLVTSFPPKPHFPSYLWLPNWLQKMRFLRKTGPFYKKTGDLWLPQNWLPHWLPQGGGHQRSPEKKTCFTTTYPYHILILRAA